MNLFACDYRINIDIKTIHIACLLEQSPLGKTLKSTNLFDVSASNFYNLRIWPPINLCITNGTE